MADQILNKSIRRCLFFSWLRVGKNAQPDSTAVKQLEHHSELSVSWLSTLPLLSPSHRSSHRQPVRMCRRAVTSALARSQLRQKGLCLPRFPFKAAARKNLPVLFISIVSYEFIKCLRGPTVSNFSCSVQWGRRVFAGTFLCWLANRCVTQPREDVLVHYLSLFVKCLSCSQWKKESYWRYFKWHRTKN